MSQEGELTSVRKVDHYGLSGLHQKTISFLMQTTFFATDAFNMCNQSYESISPTPCCLPLNSLAPSATAAAAQHSACACASGQAGSSAQ